MHTAIHIRVIPKVLLHINVSKDHYSFLSSPRRIVLKTRIFLKCFTTEDVGMTMPKNAGNHAPNNTMYVPEDWDNKVYIP